MIGLKRYIGIVAVIFSVFGFAQSEMDTCKSSISDSFNESEMVYLEETNVFSFIDDGGITEYRPCGCNIDVIIELGQSNAGARCGDDLSLVTSDGDAHVWNTNVGGNGYGFGDLLEFGSNTGYVGFSDHYSVGSVYANEFSKENCNVTVLLKVADGGTSLFQDPNDSDWNVNTPNELYQTTLDAYDDLIAWAGTRNVNVLKVIWTQGEADTGATNSANYYSNMTDLINGLNGHIGQLPEWNFIKLKTGSVIYPANGITNINNAFDQLAIDFSGVAHSTEQYTWCDNVHLNAAAIVDLGLNQIQ